MTVGVATLYNSFNYGAYLQAYAMQRHLASLGHAVVMVNFGGPFDELRHYRRLASRRPRALAFGVRKMRAFRRAWTAFDVVRDRRTALDVVFAGSDEIWNVTNDSFPRLRAFYGLDVNARVRASYAPSIGGAPADEVERCREALDGIRALDFVSGRDEATVAVARRISAKPVEKVVDPTLLVSWEDYRGGASDDYAVVYTYRFDERKRALALDFARRHGVRLVSPGFYNTWCDAVVPCGPFEFLELVSKARFVITDSFHGTIFAALLQRNFVTFTRAHRKVAALVDDLGLADRDGDGAARLDEILASPPDYRRVQERVAALVRPSTCFIARVLDAAAGVAR